MTTWNPQANELFLKALEAESKKPVAALPCSFQGANHLAFSAAGQRPAAAFWDDTVGVWEIKSQKLLHTFRHSDRVTCVAFHPKGRQLAPGSCDNTAKVWDLETGKELETLRGHIGYVMALACSGDGKLLATASGHRYAGEILAARQAPTGPALGHRRLPLLPPRGIGT